QTLGASGSTSYPLSQTWWQRYLSEFVDVMRELSSQAPRRENHLEDDRSEWAPGSDRTAHDARQNASVRHVRDARVTFHGLWIRNSGLSQRSSVAQDTHH